MSGTEITRLQAEIADLSRRLEAAQTALLAERFKDIPRLAADDVVLVPRKLFGKAKWWPAKIVHVHLDYNSGTFAGGEPWEHHLVSYAVSLQRQDGTFSSTTEGYYHSEILPMPNVAEPSPGKG